jgi:hypothetical protein
MIDQAGRKLRGVIRDARKYAALERGGIRGSVEAFMKQLDGNDGYLQVLLREMSTGPEPFRLAVDRELNYFEEELRGELEGSKSVANVTIYKPDLVAKAITRLVFTMGAIAADSPKEERANISEQTIEMIRMIAIGAQAMGAKSGSKRDKH